METEELKIEVKNKGSIAKYWKLDWCQSDGSQRDRALTLRIYRKVLHICVYFSSAPITNALESQASTDTKYNRVYERLLAKNGTRGKYRPRQCLEIFQLVMPTRNT